MALNCNSSFLVEIIIRLLKSSHQSCAVFLLSHRYDTPSFLLKTIQRVNYQNIFLSEEEYAELKEDYPDRLERFIEEMSRYLAASGKSYQNYAAALRIWAGNDKKGTRKKGIKSPFFKDTAVSGRYRCVLFLFPSP